MNVRILLSVLLFYIPVQAQTYFPSIFQGMGNTGLASESVYSISTNGAGIATLQRPTAALAYQPHFMTKDLRTLAAYCGIPLKNIGSFGLGVRNYGIAQVSSFLTGNFTYSRNFGNIFSTSLTANYHHYNVKNYIADNAFSLDLGALVKFGEQVNVGFYFEMLHYLNLKMIQDNIYLLNWQQDFYIKCQRNWLWRGMFITNLRRESMHVEGLAIQLQILLFYVEDWPLSQFSILEGLG
ncbi:hypothetical protein [Sphingobacterium bovistauri]|uniref:Type IX secretion system membrane protein, PorP/SprF family n=1 Tax=Sphingobacterium bovistauri TaxID=2781959 RepID=A0ABS7ZA43_9SPHI|nr:hypothetical protein [Sphingobacterium bovistauri]MCA5005579.1 hypothetical protein [Sphingobacterium bovistauri]